jgi:hypothetical protein
MIALPRLLVAAALLLSSSLAVAEQPSATTQPTTAPVAASSIAPLDETQVLLPMESEVVVRGVPQRVTVSRVGNLGLRSDTMLHPGDSFTAYTLKRGELVYNQAIKSLPLPSWAWWGVTDRLTVEIDLLPLLGGFFVAPHLPVPSVNARYKLRAHVGKGPAFAVEAMFQRQWRPFDGQLDPKSTVHLVRDGASLFARLNMSQILTPTLRLHASLGANWAQHLTIENQNIEVARGRSFTNLISPDASLSLDWRFSERFSLHLTGSYGTTFVYLDNIPRKVELLYALRVAPFYKSKVGFFRVMRLEAAAFLFYFQDAKETLALPIPLFPYLYWQW